MLSSVCRKLVALAVVTVLSACVGGTFETMYDTPLSVEQTQAWRVVGVDVEVPTSLSVSEARTVLPDADIVWREDPIGNRYEQVARIVAEGVRKGSNGLKGPRRVKIDVTVSRFHAMTLEAEALNYGVGVHNISFTVRVADAKTGAVLVPPTFIRAEFPALTGVRMTEARLRGETQRSQIEAHLARVIAGWLGVGPDPRVKFSTLGG